MFLSITDIDCSKYYFSLLHKLIKMVKIVIWGQCYKSFYSRKLQIFVISQSVCSSQAQLFELSLIFSGEATSLPLSGAPERCFTWISSCLTCRHLTRLERLARVKHSSLLHKWLIYDCKKYYNSVPWRYKQAPLYSILEEFTQALNWASQYSA